MVRSTSHRVETLITTLKALVDDVARNESSETIRVFRRENLDSDLCIVLKHEGDKTGPGASPLALHLAAALKEAASVRHTIWSEFVP